jgi:hypothetical protein
MATSAEGAQSAAAKDADATDEVSPPQPSVGEMSITARLPSFPKVVATTR